MPIAINQLESTVEVEDARSTDHASNDADAAEALQRWKELAVRQAELEARTAAWGFDD